MLKAPGTAAGGIEETPTSSLGENKVTIWSVLCVADKVSAIAVFETGE